MVSLSDFIGLLTVTVSCCVQAVVTLCRLLMEQQSWRHLMSVFEAQADDAQR